MSKYYNQKKFMNRAERRKNGIKTEKKLIRHTNYTMEELERILKRELNALINEPYSETVKRERYRRLQPLIEEYKRQKLNLQTQTKKTVSNSGKESDRREAYNRQKQSLPTNRAYQNLNGKIYKDVKRCSVNSKNVADIYQTQSAYAKNCVQKQTKLIENQKATLSKNEKAPKKGFFRRILDAFKPTPITKTACKKQKINSPQISETHKKYRKVERIKEVKKLRDDIYNEFEKALRDMNNYSKENSNYKIYKNGHLVKNEPRYY